MKRLLLTAALAIATAASTYSPAEPLALWHFDLKQSAPTKDAHLMASPSEVRLWFTQAPQDGSTSIRLVTSDGNEAPTGDVVQDPDDPTVFSVPVEGTLAAGTYTVAWRALGQDGHVVRDTFGFMVMDH